MYIPYVFIRPSRDGPYYVIGFGGQASTQVSNDPKINRILPLLQGNHVAKFGKGLIYRTKVTVRKPVWMPARRSKVKVTITINRISDNRVVST
jgi:hypothetical protein